MAPERSSDNSGAELGRFLRARRSQVTPADVGFAPGTGVGRTPGLRREEVAALAGGTLTLGSRECNWKKPPASVSASTWPNPAPPTATP